MFTSEFLPGIIWSLHTTGSYSWLTLVAEFARDTLGCSGFPVVALNKGVETIACFGFWRALAYRIALCACCLSLMLGTPTRNWRTVMGVALVHPMIILFSSLCSLPTWLSLSCTIGRSKSNYSTCPTIYMSSYTPCPCTQHVQLCPAIQCV